MIEEIERCLADNGDLEATVKRLTDKVNEQRADRLREIRHDIDLAKLIREALNEPTGTGMYMIARCYIREYKRKYYPKGKYKLAVELMREAEREKSNEHNNDSEVRKGETDHDTKEREQSEVTTTETVV